MTQSIEQRHSELLHVAQHDAVSAPSRTDNALLQRVTHYDPLPPDRGQVLRLVGLRPGRPAHARWLATVDELTARLLPLTRPRAAYRIDRVRRLERRRLALESGAVFKGAIGMFLAHSTLVASFIVTIGSALERLARRWLRGGQVMRATVADAIAAEAAEAVAQRCQDDIRAWASPQGLDITPRYSPGYCGMSVRQQVPLFASLAGLRVGVKLTPSCLMTPIKSVSGLIGIGPAERVRPADYPCRFCNLEGCMQRRVEFTPRGDGEEDGAGRRGTAT